MAEQTRYESYAGFRNMTYLKSSAKELYLVHCGMEQCKPGHVWPEIRSEYHMHFVLKGKGVFALDGPEAPLSRGDVFVVPKGKKCYYQADMLDPWWYFWVAFDGTKAEHFLEQAGFSASSMVRKAYAPPEEYYAFVEDILEARRLTRANELRRQSDLYEIIALLLRTRIPAGAGSEALPSYSKDTLVNHAVQYMQSNYSNTTIAKVAEYVGLNRCYMSTLFKSEMGLSPQDYLLHIRMEKAMRLLETTDKQVKEVSALVGYEDPLNFSKVFRRFYGVSPRQYRSTH